ncbi:MAG: cytochrome oxidase small assembly protein [Sulfuritalea sp.]|nr:cytochrome oxidase small assembly protein [Sulfuritalea sp.]
MSTDTSREQGNRRIAIGLALFAAAVFLSVIIRQWLANP